MNIAWNTRKSSLVRIDMLEERRAPRGNRHRINKYDLVEIASTDEVGSKYRRTAEVVANDGRILKSPVIQKMI